MWLSALLLGFAGSLHCVGMCGPLVMQINPKGSAKLIGHRLLYHTGRIFMYGLMGIAAGTLGQFVEINGWQGKLSIIVGIILLVAMATTYLQRWFTPRIGKAIAFIKYKLSFYMHQKSVSAVMLTGAFNGLLPCGLVYTALTLSLVQPDVFSGVTIMLLFGLGTVPALLTMSYISTGFFRYIPFAKVQSALMILVSVTMIWRGFSIELDPTLAIPVCH
jgi:sulfite exporter TauE/SafE